MSDVTDLKAEVLTLRMENKELWGQVERLRNQLRDQQDTAEHNFVRNAREYKRVCDENDRLREQGARLFDKTLELGTENTKLRKENDTLCRRIDELCMEVDSLRRTARRIVVSDGGVGHCACSACGGAIDQDDAWCRHCGTRLEGE